MPLALLYKPSSILLNRPRMPAPPPELLLPRQVISLSTEDGVLVIDVEQEDSPNDRWVGNFTNSYVRHRTYLHPPAEVALPTST